MITPVISVAMIIALSPFGSVLGFGALPWPTLLVISVLAASYLLAAELLKTYVRPSGKGGAKRKAFPATGAIDRAVPRRFASPLWGSLSSSQPLLSAPCSRLTAMLEKIWGALSGGSRVFEDHGSTRIDLACPHCRRLFKVRLRKLQFGADLTCRLCRHEFSARDVADRPEIRKALARMHEIVTQRVASMTAAGSPEIAGERDEGSYRRAAIRVERAAGSPK